MDNEKRFQGRPLDERVILNNTESPKMGQLWALFYVAIAEPIPQDIEKATLKAAIRESDGIKIVISNWNKAVEMSLGQQASMLTLIALTGSIARSYGVRGPKSYAQRVRDLADHIHKLRIGVYGR